MTPKTVLVADDSASMRQTIGFTLTQAGSSVVAASDGRDATKKLESVKPSLVITDLNMPNMGRIELIAYLRASPLFKFIPINMLTTESQQDKKYAGRKAGATAWIVKPFKGEQLLAVIAKIVREETLHCRRRASRIFKRPRSCSRRSRKPRGAELRIESEPENEPFGKRYRGVG